MSLEPVAVTVVTGFLGAGKTTLINRLLNDPALRDTAVIVNEFGEVAVDHLLVEKASEELIEIAGGCLCCTVRGELAETLAGLIDRIQTGKLKPLSRILIETTGMADPVPVLYAIQSHPALAQALQLDRVITVVDALSGAHSLDTFDEAKRQLAVADLVVVTKTANTSDTERAGLQAAIASHTAAPAIDADDMKSPVASLLETVPQPAGHLTPDRTPNPAGHDHRHAHTAAESLVLSHDGPLPGAAIAAFLDDLLNRHGDRLLRVKGLAELEEYPARPVVIQAVQRILSPPRRLAAWPDMADRGTRLVIIGIEPDRDAITRLFDGYTGRVSVDTPDRAALSDNPLAIPGLGRAP